MKPRLLLVLVLVCGVSAFAPAPLPRRGKTDNHPLSLKTLHGRWRVVSMWRYGQKGEISYRIDVWKEIRIENGQWSFCKEENGVIVPTTTYKLAIDTTQTPTTIDFVRLTDNKPWMMGVVRRKNDQLEVLYKPSTPERPNSFENPMFESYLFTLRRIN